MTVVIPGNGHRTAMPRTSFRAFMTVVATLWLHYSRNWASAAMPSLPCTAFQAFVTVIPGTWTSIAMPHAGIWHL